jgi:hypothetical protein
VVTKLCVAVERLDRMPATFRHAQFAEAHAQLSELIGLFEDLQYEAAMTHECEVEKEAEERDEYERLKAKFGS